MSLIYLHDLESSKDLNSCFKVVPEVERDNFTIIRCK